MKFGDKLLELRKQKGWSQEELGDKLDVSRQTVSKWEAGQTTPEMEKLILMSEVFNVTLDEIMIPDKKENKEFFSNINELLEKDNLDENLKKQLENFLKITNKKEKNGKIAKLIFLIIICIIILFVGFRAFVVYKIYSKTVAIISNLPWTGGKVIVENYENEINHKIEYYLLRNEEKYILKKVVFVDNYSQIDKEVYIDLKNINSEGNYNGVCELNYKNNTYKIIDNYEENVFPASGVIEELVRGDYTLDILNPGINYYMKLALDFTNNIGITDNKDYYKLHYYIGNEEEKLIFDVKEDNIIFAKKDFMSDGKINVKKEYTINEIGKEYSNYIMEPDLNEFELVEN